MIDVSMDEVLKRDALESALKKIMLDRRVAGAPTDLESSDYLFLGVWFGAIAQFVLYSFDRTFYKDELTFVEFKRYARADVTMRKVLQMFTPPRVDFPTLGIARRYAIAAREVYERSQMRDSEEKESPPDAKKAGASTASAASRPTEVETAATTTAAAGYVIHLHFWCFKC